MPTPLRSVADFGALVRDRRRTLGLDQAELAKRADVSRLWVNEVEQGKRNAGLGRILRTLEVLGITVLGELKEERPRAPSRAAAILDRLRGDTGHE